MWHATSPHCGTTEPPPPWIGFRDSPLYDISPPLHLGQGVAPKR